MRRFLGAALAGAVLLVCAPVAHGQASKQEMMGFPMPPPSGYAQTKTFGYPGDYGYYTLPSSSKPGSTANASDYRYVRYSGVAGKDVWLYGTWGTTPVPAPSGNADACGHAHTSYGVWARYRPAGQIHWLFLGGGGMSGQRASNGKCVFKVDNPLSSIDPRFGWGKEFLHFNLKNTTAIDQLVLGVLSNTHGWGSCVLPPNVFKACHEPSYAIAYTLP